ncbi:MAG: xanthine dehydrogenase FAD-binding subunit XdhB [Treponema sp.]|jgi:xanthine dehydrogenase FAD-binding subunit|nr:xanthine dehydrogenase FAD-binding subunit XdhB [Treponema sp.]
MYDIETLYEAESVDHAIKLLEEHPEAKIIAGGSDVLIKIREGDLAGISLVSIQGLDELRGIRMEGDDLWIGALTSFSHIARDPLILKHIPVLAEAADTIGGPQLRNIATIGGNVCNGVTSADSASTLLAWDAVMEYRGPDGIRKAPIQEHYVSAGKTSIRPAELLLGIIIPKASYENCFGYYIKYAMREALDIATLGCSVNVKLSQNRRNIERLRMAYGVAGPIPLRAKSAEEEAAGKPLNAQSIDLVAEAALGDINPRSSWRASKEFRIQLAGEMARRAITESLRRAGGEP